jgi:tetratricopeptide (TPR) repeat protein
LAKISYKLNNIVTGLTLRDQIKQLREEGNRSIKNGDGTTALDRFNEALRLAESTGDENLRFQICDDIDHCRLIQLRDQGRKILAGDVKNVKEADDIFTQALAIADAAKLQRGVDRPELIQELYRDLDYCQALSLKEAGKKAFLGKDYPQAVELYTKALQKADMAEKREIFLQLLINRSLVHTRLGDHTLALEDARCCIELAPNSCYKVHSPVSPIN